MCWPVHPHCQCVHKGGEGGKKRRTRTETRKYSSLALVNTLASTITTSMWVMKHDTQ